MAGRYRLRDYCVPTGIFSTRAPSPLADTDVPLKFDHRSVIRTVTRLPSSLAIWASGARSEVLEHCPSEQLLFAALGASVLLTALYQGFAASFALSYALHMPMSHVWVIGAVWGVTFVNIDRLILMIGSSRRGWLALMPRFLLAILLGVVMAAVLTVHIFAPEINQNLAVTQQSALSRQDILHRPHLHGEGERLRGRHRSMADERGQAQTNDDRGQVPPRL